MKYCMPERSCVRLCGVYSCPSSRLASFMNTQSQYHGSVVLLVESTLMGHFWLLCSFHSYVHDVNTWTAHTVDFCVFFTTIGFLAALISSLEIVASKCCVAFFGFDGDSRGHFMSATKCHLGVGNNLEPCISSWQKQDYRRLSASTQISNSNNQKCSWCHCNFFPQWHVMTSSSQYEQ